MNKWLFAAFFLFVSVAGFSQVSIGAQGGGVLSSPSIKSTDLFNLDIVENSRMNWQAGILLDIPLGEEGWRFMPEFKYVNKGFSEDFNSSAFGASGNISGYSNISYLELPFNIAYSIEMGNSNLIIGAGPYAGYAISGKNDFVATLGGAEVNTRKGDIDFGSDPGQIKPFDYGANISVGYLLSGGLMFKANYNLGLANISNEGNGSSYKNNYFGLSIVYFFKRAGE